MIFSVTLPSDGTNADVRDYNDPILQILAGLNGQLNDDNISGLSGSKITANTLPESALTDALKTGWLTQSTLPTSIVALGNRSYTVNYGSSVAGIKSPGMRNRLVRQTTTPNQSASLNGTTQYFVKTSPNKMSWTDDFAIGAWVKLSGYPGSFGAIAARYNGTSGWSFDVSSTGQVRLIGLNGGSGNNSGVTSYQSLPLNKWVYVSAQLDMSAFTATTTTSYIMFDGVNVPTVIARAGTNPTTLIQAGDLNIGAQNSLLFFPGKIAQLAIYNAKVTQATILASMNQPLTGSETNLASGYSLSNSVLDLNTTTPNDLSVGGGSATTTNADSPFGNSGVSTSIEFGITMAVASNGLSETIQVPEGCTLPTTGNISSMSYSTQKVPYGWPRKPFLKTEAILQSPFNSTAVSTVTDVLGLSIPYTASGTETIRLKLNPYYVVSSAGSSAFVEIFIRDSTTKIAGTGYTVGGSNYAQSPRVEIDFNPTAGAHTFVASISQNSAGTMTLNGAAGTPAIFSLEVLEG